MERIWPPTGNIGHYAICIGKPPVAYVADRRILWEYCWSHQSFIATMDLTRVVQCLETLQKGLLIMTFLCDQEVSGDCSIPKWFLISISRPRTMADGSLVNIVADFQNQYCKLYDVRSYPTGIHPVSSKPLNGDIISSRHY